MRSPRRILILGVGSSFGADRLGWRAVEAMQQSGLAARFPALTLTFQQSDRPGSRLLTLLRDCDAALVVDAMCSGSPPGTVARFGGAELPAGSGLFSSHGFGVADALALGRQLGMLPATVIVYGVEAEPKLTDDTLPAQSITELTAMLEEDLAALQTTR